MMLESLLMLALSQLIMGFSSLLLSLISPSSFLCGFTAVCEFPLIWLGIRPAIEFLLCLGPMLNWKNKTNNKLTWCLLERDVSCRGWGWGMNGGFHVSWQELGQMYLLKWAQGMPEPSSRAWSSSGLVHWVSSSLTWYLISCLSKECGHLISILKEFGEEGKHMDQLNRIWSRREDGDGDVWCMYSTEERFVGWDLRVCYQTRVCRERRQDFQRGHRTQDSPLLSWRTPQTFLRSYWVSTSLMNRRYSPCILPPQTSNLFYLCH